MGSTWGEKGKIKYGMGIKQTGCEGTYVPFATSLMDPVGRRAPTGYGQIPSER